MTTLFTFHSGYIPIIWKNRGRDEGIKLYIPFWLYSNRNECSWIWEYFSLHSILVIFQCKGSKAEGSRRTFTFHSGYIPMPTDEMAEAMETSLHSILVIFQ